MIPLEARQVEARTWLHRRLPPTIAEISREGWRRPEDVVVGRDGSSVLTAQHLGLMNPAIRRMTDRELDLTCVGVYWMVWLDEAIAVHERRQYPAWREITRAPALVGAGGVRLSPTSILTSLGGRNANSFEVQMQRRAALHYLTPAVESLVTRLAGTCELPCLVPLFELGIEELELSRWSVRHPVVDPVGPSGIDSWRVPSVTLEALTRGLDYSNAPTQASQSPPGSPISRP